MSGPLLLLCVLTSRAAVGLGTRSPAAPARCARSAGTSLPPRCPCWRSVTALHVELGTRFWLRLYQAGTTTQADYRELIPQPTTQGSRTFALTVSGGNYDAVVETTNANGNGTASATQRDIAVGEPPQRPGCRRSMPLLLVLQHAWPGWPYTPLLLKLPVARATWLSLVGLGLSLWHAPPFVVPQASPHPLCPSLCPWRARARAPTSPSASPMVLQSEWRPSTVRPAGAHARLCPAAPGLV